MQHILIVCDSSEVPSFDKACESFIAFSEALRKSPAPKVNLTADRAEFMTNAPYEPAELRELRTVARQLAVQHQLQDDATPVQVMIILSNLLKSLSSQVGKLEKQQSAPTTKYRSDAIRADDFIRKHQQSVLTMTPAAIAIRAEECALRGHGNRVRSGNYIVCEHCRTIL